MLRFVRSAPAQKMGELFYARLRFLLVIGLLASFGLLSASLATAQITLQNDFEDGTNQGWIPRGSAVLTNTTEQAHGGTHSLKTTGRTAGFNGPSLDITSIVTPGATYTVDAWVRLVDPANSSNPSQPTSDSLKFTLQPTISGTQSFIQVTSSATVTNSAWVELQGSVTIPTGASDLLLYLEAAGANTDYYLDDFTLSGQPPTSSGCATPPDNSGIHANFDDGTTDGFAPHFGIGTVSVQPVADAPSQPNALLTTGRTGSFAGPAIDASGKMCNGSQYRLSVKVKLAPTATADDTLRVSADMIFADNSEHFATLVGNTAVPNDGAWHNLTAVTNFAFNYSKLTVYVESATLTQDFYIDDFDVTFIPPVQIEQNIPSVFQTFADLFPIGTAIDSADLTGPHSQLWVKHFNSMTSGNDMKFDATEPTEGNFTFTSADAQVAFAQKNNIRIRGHNLVWSNGSQTPAWVFLEKDGVTPLSASNPADVALLTSRMQDHITKVMQHFGTATYAWDVVNEPIDSNQPDCLQHGPWYNILGPSYLDMAFQFARTANPSAELFLNDFNTTTDPRKTCLFNVVKGMIARGVPIDAVGHEMHSNLQFPPVQSLADTVNQLHTLTTVTGKPLDQQVTEFDISVYFGSNPTIFTDYSQIPQDFFVQQGYLYRDFFQVLKQLNSDPNDKKISGVTFWGMADDDTWLTSPSKVDGPLLFDTGLQHKPAYTGIIDPLDLPGADLSVTMSANSGTILSGQSVAYTITVTNNGHDDAAALTLTDALPGGTTFQSIMPPGGWTCTTPAVGSNGTVSCTAAALANGGTAQFTLTAGIPCGTHNGTMIANSAAIASTTRDPNPDATNNTATVNVSVSNPPPVISGLTAHPNVLWPPDTLLHEVTLNYTITDNCTTAIVPVITITSNQPANAPRPRIIPTTDWKVVDAHHVQLRAIIDPLTIKGRTYTITLTATDSANSSTTGSVKVDIPLLPLFLF
jgi:endo-1,4-beta-xylanase